MKISQNEAGEALDAIQKVTQKTRASITQGGAYVYLLMTGAVWLVGFVANQFLSGPWMAVIWVSISLLGAGISIPLGARLGRRVRSQGFNPTARRIVIFWVLLTLFAFAIMVVAHPADGRQASLMVVLFLMLGQMSMGMILSFSATWWSLPIAALALLGYYLVPGYFSLWMGVLVGGSMIALALVIRHQGQVNG